MDKVRELEAGILAFLQPFCDVSHGGGSQETGDHAKGQTLCKCEM